MAFLIMMALSIVSAPEEPLIDHLLGNLMWALPMAVIVYLSARIIADRSRGRR
jgi:hypothetical protein